MALVDELLVENGDITLRVEVTGDGPTILCVSGWPELASSWHNQVKFLAEHGYRVASFDVRGYGGSSVPKEVERYTLRELTGDVAAVAAALSDEPIVLVGHDWGAPIVWNTAIRHPEKVRKVVSISAWFASDGWVKEARDFWPNFTSEMMKGSPAEIGYKKLNPNPDGFPKFFNHLKATAMRQYDFGSDKLKATKAPMFFIHGDADGVRLEHISEMFSLKGGGVSGDLGTRSASRLAIVPGTTHVTLINKMSILVPMINDFLDAKQ